MASGVDLLDEKIGVQLLLGLAEDLCRLGLRIVTGVAGHRLDRCGDRGTLVAADGESAATTGDLELHLSIPFVSAASRDHH